MKVWIWQSWTGIHLSQKPKYYSPSCLWSKTRQDIFYHGYSAILVCLRIKHNLRTNIRDIEPTTTAYLKRSNTLVGHAQYTSKTYTDHCLFPGYSAQYLVFPSFYFLVWSRDKRNHGDREAGLHPCQRELCYRVPLYEMTEWKQSDCRHVLYSATSRLRKQCVKTEEQSVLSSSMQSKFDK